MNELMNYVRVSTHDGSESLVIAIPAWMVESEANNAYANQIMRDDRETLVVNKFREATGLTVNFHELTVTPVTLTNTIPTKFSLPVGARLRGKAAFDYRAAKKAQARG